MEMYCLKRCFVMFFNELSHQLKLLIAFGHIYSYGIEPDTLYIFFLHTVRLKKLNRYTDSQSDGGGVYFLQYFVLIGSIEILIRQVSNGLAKTAIAESDGIDSGLDIMAVDNDLFEMLNQLIHINIGVVGDKLKLVRKLIQHRQIKQDESLFPEFVRLLQIFPLLFGAVNHNSINQMNRIQLYIQMFIIYVFLAVIMASLAQVYFSNDPAYIQADQVSLYNSYYPLKINLTSTAVFQVNFDSTPNVFAGIIELDIAPEYWLSYSLSTLNISITSVVFAIAISSTTFVYKNSVSYVALSLPPLYITTYTYIPQVCSQHIYASCNQSFPLPISPTLYYSLFTTVGFSVFNNYTTKSTNNSYKFNVYQGQNSQGGWRVYLSTGPTTNMQLLNISYLYMPLATANSNNQTISTYTFYLNSNSATFQFTTDLYSSGYQSSARSTFIGLIGFDLAPYQNLQFSVAPSSYLTIKLLNMYSSTSTLYLMAAIFGVGKCPSWYISVYAPDITCLSCPTTCTACSGYLCTSCQPNRQLQYIVGTTGICVCKTGFYEDSSTCYACDSSCLTCFGSATYCTSCVSQLQLQANRCVTLCQLNFYIADSGCVSCPQGCSKCASSTACINFVCSTPDIYFMGSCYSTCPSNTYLNANLNSCVSCSNPCVSCLNDTACTTCVSGFYYSATSYTCYICYSLCSTCTGPAFNNCTGCIGSNYILNSSICTLIYCSANQYIDSDNKCQPCPAGCATCNSTSCYACTSNYIFSAATCMPCNLSGVAVVNNQCRVICGDGIITMNQQCDDGNTINGDGCSSQCLIEPGYTCIGDGNSPNYCILYSQFGIQISKSLINNRISFQFEVPSCINYSAVIACQDNSISSYSLSCSNNLFNIVAQFNMTLQNKQCNISIANRLVYTTNVMTLPVSYFYSESLLSQIVNYSLFLKYVSMMCMVIATCTHFLSNSFASYSFMQTLSICVLLLCNYQYITPLVYNLILELKYLLLINQPNTTFTQKQFSPFFIYGLEDKLDIVDNLLIMLAFFIFLMICGDQLYQALKKNIYRMFRIHIKQKHIFLYESFAMYEPIFLYVTLGAFSTANYSTTLSLVLVCAYLIVVLCAFYLFVKCCMIEKEHKFLATHFIQQIRCLLCSLALKYLDAKYASNCLIVLVSSIAVMIIYRKIDHQKTRKRLLYYQQIINELFLTTTSLLILSGKYTSNINIDEQTTLVICSWLMIVALLTFLVANAVIMCAIFVDKLYRVIREKQVHPQRINLSTTAKTGQVSWYIPKQDGRRKNDQSNLQEKTGKQEDSASKIIFDI